MRNFNVGDKVVWDGNPDETGEVTDVCDGYLFIEWDAVHGTPRIRERYNWYDTPLRDRVSKTKDNNLNELSAVELLLSLGYTLSKS